MGPRGRTDEYGQELIPDSELRGEREREWIREKCGTGNVFEPAWYLDSANIAALMRWLRERDELGDMDNAIYLVSKPWKWDDEWKRMQAEKQT